MDIARYAIRQPVNIWLLILFCLLGGVFGYVQVNRLEDPEFVIKEAIVTTPYPGADSEQVEREVTDVLETAVQRMPQLKNIRARSLRGMSELRIEIQDKYDANKIPQVWDELRRRINDSARLLPPGAGQPLVNDDFGDVFGIFYVMTGEGMRLDEVYDAAKTLRRGLLATKGVGQIMIAGNIAEQFIVEIPQAQLAALRISPQELSRAMEDAQRRLPAGSVRTDGLRVYISPSGAYDTTEELRRLPIGSGNARILLGDIATIRRQPSEQPDQRIAYKGAQAITFGIAGLSGVNIVDVGEAVRKRIAELKPQLPLGVELHAIYNQPQVVDDAISSFVVDLLISLGIVAVCLCLFMGLKAGVIVSSIIVLSIGGTLFAMYAIGLELERVSLAALVIAMGMLVDNALVICDGAQVRMRRGASALAGVRETGAATQIPLLGATAIGILAFSGVGLSQDQTGEFLSSLFAVILISLLLSWVLAVTVVPMLVYYWLAPKDRREDEESAEEQSDEKPDAEEDEKSDKKSVADTNGKDPAFSGRIYDGFRAVVRVSLRFSVPVVVMAAGLTGLAFFGFGQVSQSFFPPAATPIGLVDLYTRGGNHIDTTYRRAGELEAAITEAFPKVKAVVRVVGQGATRFMLNYAPEQPDPAYAQLMLMVDDPEDLKGILTGINRKMPDRFPDLDLHAWRLVFGSNPEAQIEARFHGPDATVLRRLSEEAQAVMREDGTLLNIRDNWRQREIVLRPRLDLDRMAEAGVSRQDVARALLTVGEGAEIGVLVEDEERRQIQLRAPNPDRAGPADLLDAMVWSAGTNRYVPLRQVADSVEPMQSDAIIHRRDRQRMISVRGEPPVGMEVEEVRQRIAGRIEDISLPPGYKLTWGGVYEDSSDAQGALLATIAAPFLGMFVITVLLFSAFRQAIIVWLVVPMAVCGVTLGLLLTAKPFDFMALLGLLSLSGLLLKNAIVLVEEIEVQIGEGKERRVAIVEGTTSRLMPIALLATTSILGMVPLLTDGLFASMAVAMMGGLGVSAVLTLVVVPCLYDLIIPSDAGRKPNDAEEGKPA